MQIELRGGVGRRGIHFAVADDVLECRVVPRAVEARLEIDTGHVSIVIDMEDEPNVACRVREPAVFGDAFAEGAFHLRGVIALDGTAAAATVAVTTATAVKAEGVAGP